MSPSDVKRTSILFVFSNSCLSGLFAALHEQRGQLPGMFIIPGLVHLYIPRARRQDGDGFVRCPRQSCAFKQNMRGSGTGIPQLQGGFQSKCLSSSGFKFNLRLII